MTFPKDKIYKKFRSIAFAEQGAAPDDIADRCFNGDQGRVAYFRSQVASVNEQINRLTKTLFPSYEIIRPSITWRMSDTINENLHVDVYPKDLPDHHLRMFVNIDSCHRVWHTSHTLETVLKTSLHLLPHKTLRKATPGRICHDLNFAVFGGFDVAGREGADKHVVFFDPGDIWFVDSRKVSHQIFYGRRAVSTDHAVSVESMQNQDRHYYSIVDRHREKFLEGQRSIDRFKAIWQKKRNPISRTL